jgi:hypothetical protein
MKIEVLIRTLKMYVEGTVEGITLAPDALSPLGGYPGNDDGRDALRKRNDA